MVRISESVRAVLWSCVRMLSLLPCAIDLIELMLCSSFLVCDATRWSLR